MPRSVSHSRELVLFPVPQHSFSSQFKNTHFFPIWQHSIRFYSSVKILVEFRVPQRITVLFQFHTTRYAYFSRTLAHSNQIHNTHFISISTTLVSFPFPQYSFYFHFHNTRFVSSSTKLFHFHFHNTRSVSSSTNLFPFSVPQHSFLVLGTSTTFHATVPLARAKKGESSRGGASKRVQVLRHFKTKICMKIKILNKNIISYWTLTFGWRSN